MKAQKTQGRTKQKTLGKRQKEEIMIEDTDDCLHSSTKWTKAIDRGGFVHVDDTVYMVFAEIELVVQRHLKQKSSS